MANGIKLTHPKKERDVYKGTVKWFDDISGYGILEREGGEEICIHVSAMRNRDTKTLKMGETLLFDIGRGRKGLEAIYALVPVRKASLLSDPFVGLRVSA